MVIMTNKLLLFSVVCACNLVLPTYYEVTRSWGSWQVDFKCNEIALLHYPTKWFVLFWMCDFIALTRCCKL